MPTATLEEYLEAIYRLDKEGPVRPSALAEAMGVSAPTVTATLQRLGERGLIYRPKGAIALTEAGERESLSILRRHRLAERLLVDILGLPWDDVHEDACLLEHALSPRVQEALERVLGFPEVCPHGHPIPSADLEMSEAPRLALLDVEVGGTVVVRAVDESDPGVLRDASEAGLELGAVVTVSDRETGATTKLLIGGSSYVVSDALAARIMVDEESEGS